jgi:hypothetical protein
VNDFQPFVSDALARAFDRAAGADDIEALAEAQAVAPMNLHKNSFAIRISREDAIAFGLEEPTPQEAADRAAEHEQWRIESAAREMALADAYGRLLDAVSPEGRLVLELHEADDSEYLRACQGCDFSGGEGEPPDWPCRTVLALAEHHGIEMGR